LANIQFYISVKNGKIEISNTVRATMEAFFKGQKDCTGFLRWHKTTNRTPKTLEQLGYYYAVILPTACQGLKEAGHEVMGIPPTKDQTDAILKHFCAVVREGGEIVNKRDMTKMECMEFITNCIVWCAKNLGCVIPEPIGSDCNPCL
jgi:hypothetical protein